MTKIEGLPKELIEQLGGQVREGKPYNAHELVLTYINNHNGSKTNELLVYLWKMQEKVTSRPYLYHILCRLRAQGLIETTNMSVPNKATHFATESGRKKARPYWEVNDERA